MNTTLFLQQYGIAEQSLSPSVKEGINEVLRKASVEGLAQLSKILEEEARKRGINSGTSTTGGRAENDAILAAQAEYEKQQADAKRKRLIIIVVSTVVIITVGVIFYLKRRPTV